MIANMEETLMERIYSEKLNWTENMTTRKKWGAKKLESQRMNINML
jgi:hypothetical protein